MALCPTNKPICFRKGPEDRREKKILKRCNNAEYNIFTALDNAYNIKNNEAGDKTDSQDQCIGSTDCFCTPFDFAWMTAIAEAVRTIDRINNPSTTTSGNDSPVNIPSLAKNFKNNFLDGHIKTFLKTISKIMRQNVSKNTQGNPLYISLFCDCIDAAMADNQNKQYEDIVKNGNYPNINDDIKNKVLIIYNGLYSLINAEKEISEIVASIPQAEIAKSLESAINANPVPLQIEEKIADDDIALSKKIMNIGNYVLNDSNHFDIHAFNDISILFTPPSSGGMQSGGMQSGGGKWLTAMWLVVLVASIAACAGFPPLLLLAIPAAFIITRIRAKIREKKKGNNPEGGNNLRIAYRIKKKSKKIYKKHTYKKRNNKRTYKRKHKKNKHTYNKRKRNKKTTKKIYK